MPLFTIAYDLNKQKDYTELTDALKAAGAKKLLYSDWTLRTDDTIRQVFNHFLQYIDGDDALVAAKIEGSEMLGIRTITPMKYV